MSNPIIEKLEKKQAQLEARIQSLKAKDMAQKRKDDNRKKILAGAYILEKHEREGTLQELVLALDKFLTRKNDRTLFGLPETKEKAAGEVLEVA